MYDYDVRNQIKTENKRKLFGEVCIMAIILAVIFCIMYGAHVDNPFRIHSPKTDMEIKSLFKESSPYITLNSVDLNFTGYYKEDEEKNVIYNCYKLTLDKLDYIVFVPPGRSGEDSQNPKQQLSNYSFEGRLRNDKELLKLIAEDYRLDEDSFLKEYNVSPIIIDEARNNRSQMLLAWILFGLLFIGYVIYIIYSFKKVEDFWSCKEVRKLGKKDEVTPIFDEINREVSKQLLFDTNKVKITKNWLMAFYDGTVIITLRNKIKSVRGVEKVKKSYGIAKIGFRLFVEIVLEDGNAYEIPVEEQQDYEEILQILKN